jgi:hypothetical protein
VTREGAAPEPPFHADSPWGPLAATRRTGQPGRVSDHGKRRWRDWLFVLLGVGVSLFVTGYAASNPWRLIVLDNHLWITLLPAALGFLALVWFAIQRRSTYEHMTLVVVLGSCCLLFTGCVGVVNVIAGGHELGAERSSISDGSHHSVVRQLIIDPRGNSTLCVEFEFRTGDGLFDRHAYQQFCDRELVRATADLSGHSFVLTRSDGTSCGNQIDWHTLNVSFGTPSDCAQSTSG